MYIHLRPSLSFSNRFSLLITFSHSSFSFVLGTPRSIDVSSLLFSLFLSFTPPPSPSLLRFLSLPLTLILLIPMYDGLTRDSSLDVYTLCSLLYVTLSKSVTSTHTNVHTRCHLRFFILYIYIYIHAYTQLYVSLYIPADKSWPHRVKT